MIIVRFISGLGNQLFQYATARRLALRHGAELKFDLSFYRDFKYRQFSLDEFNIEGSIATDEEVARVRSIHPTLGQESLNVGFMPEVLDYPDDVHLNGYWGDERYWLDIIDRLRAEFTLKNPPSEAAMYWAERIESAECAVSIHVRHGDYVFNRAENYRGILPLEYYYDCIEALKREYPRLTVFAFSNNLEWVKKYFRPSAPAEFVEGTRDVEELILMSRCRHNIIANSTFSHWGARLNSHPDRKIFCPWPGSKIDNETTPPPPDPSRVNDPNSSESWIKMPVDWSLDIPKIEYPPMVSIILTFDNDEARAVECLSNIIDVDFEYYEVIVIDNASTDRTLEICRSFIAVNDRVKVLRASRRTSKGALLNRGLEAARSEFIVFADVSGFMFPTGIRDLFRVDINHKAGMMHASKWYEEDETGTLIYRGRRFKECTWKMFGNVSETMKVDWAPEQRIALLTLGGLNGHLGSNMFRREFLIENEIKFDERPIRWLEMSFMIRCQLSTDALWVSPAAAWMALK